MMVRLRRYIATILLIAGLCVPAIAQVGLDTEALLFRSYGDGQGGAVQSIERPAHKPAAKIPLPAKKPMREYVDSTVQEPTAKPDEEVKAVIAEEEPETVAVAETTTSHISDMPIPAKKPVSEEMLAKVTEAAAQDKSESPIQAILQNLINAQSDIRVPEKKPIVAQETVQEAAEPVVEAPEEEVQEAPPASVEAPADNVEVADAVIPPAPMRKPYIERIQSRVTQPRVQQRIEPKAAKAPKFVFNGDDDRQNATRSTRREEASRSHPANKPLPRSGRKTNVVIKTRSGIEWLFHVELATDDESHREGLMYRASLSEESGMLFLYPRPQQVSMWMKNTKIPLDMIFIAPGGRIVKIHESARPGSLKGISSGRAVRGVLEINGGMARELGIAEGDQVIHDALRS